jgi:hypothetical protein
MAIPKNILKIPLQPTPAPASIYNQDLKNRFPGKIFSLTMLLRYGKYITQLKGYGIMKRLF